MWRSVSNFGPVPPSALAGIWGTDVFVAVKRLSTDPGPDPDYPPAGHWDRPEEWAGDELTHEEHLSERVYSVLSPTWALAREWPLSWGLWWLGPVRTVLGPTRWDIWRASLFGDVAEARAQRTRRAFERTVRDAKAHCPLSVETVLRRVGDALGGRHWIEPRQRSARERSHIAEIALSGAACRPDAARAAAERLAQRWSFPGAVLIHEHGDDATSDLVGALVLALETEYAYASHGMRPPIYVGHRQRVEAAMRVTRRSRDIRYLWAAMKSIEYGEHNRRSGTGFAGRYFWHRGQGGQLKTRFPTGRTVVDPPWRAP